MYLRQSAAKAHLVHLVYKLIKIYELSPRFITCDCCDTFSEEVNTYYVISQPADHFQASRKYCELCKNKVGIVVDWEELKERNGKKT